jgi:hypothetical protein
MAGRREKRRPGRRDNRGLYELLRDNSLSIALFPLFGLALCLHAIAAWHQHNSNLAAHGRPPSDLLPFLTSGSFLDALAVNWQAAILQLASLIIFSGFLYQRGAAHSRKPKNDRQHGRHGFGSWLYRNSLFITFAVLFAIAFACHAVAGEHDYNFVRALIGQPPVSLTGYLVSARFWSSTLGTWEAEYGVIALYIVLSIFLRQEGSAESKPPEAGNDSTGEANK